ncbi:FGGY-family carbohydrate kinase [Roseinatronobacter monicus]|uniref:Sugar (Pentulose or hexulose) kinase n=1 Tax=Roseinatronobacter monicus TaxID=393481 RepID=A0A543KGY4_9RHOB|nr:FGGY-family carbohydrate kinase [Roseinatronobacter monicus]TQM94345.1 sugar (pentulose or hexulose) kinase [Roseinatronobacter monicus]
MSAIAVIDIGKTNAKLALVDPESLDEIAVLTRPNTVRPGPPWPHFDTEGHWRFLPDGLRALNAQHPVSAISITTHGACAALLDEQGNLAAPILDYEHDGPDTCRRAYDALRPPFAQTGSPSLGAGLNLGAQIFWQFREVPELAARVAHVVTYPQYWAFRLTGERACDVTSLGCHTDLWDMSRGQPSDLVARLGLTQKLAKVRKPGDVLGHLHPAIAAHTGLAPDTPVVCGIHDSNASLLPHLLTQNAPFGVISTGTWVVAMAIGGAPVALDEGRDLLVNINALGAPVPSARFMGGREYDLALQGAGGTVTSEGMAQVLQQDIMLLPCLAPGSGPFPDHASRWHGPEPTLGSDTRVAALGFYLALVSAECLRLIGQRGPVIVEGPFGKNRAFLTMLQAASGAEVIRAKGLTGTSQGAALLCGGQPARVGETLAPLDRTTLGQLEGYASRWLQMVRQHP